MPPRGAHHGIFAMPSAVGKGRGKIAATIRNKAKTKPKETKVATHGFVSDVRKVPFIGGPMA
jgi:hypothetical protein